MVKSMAINPIIFACSNPNPEIKRELAFANTRLNGRDPKEHFDGDYYLIPLLLSRPRAEAARLPIDDLRDRESGDVAS